jgi:HPt (histidine-containing phosphotransfer) domain-containing protein
MKSHVDECVLDNYRSIQKPGQPDIVKRLVGIYLKNSPEIMRDICKAAENRNTEKLWRSAHSLKSSSANLGANTLAQLCEDLEIMGRGKKMNTGMQLIMPLEEEYRAVVVELKKYSH